MPSSIESVIVARHRSGNWLPRYAVEPEARFCYKSLPADVQQSIGPRVERLAQLHGLGVDVVSKAAERLDVLEFLEALPGAVAWLTPASISEIRSGRSQGETLTAFIFRCGITKPGFLENSFSDGVSLARGLVKPSAGFVEWLRVARWSPRTLGSASLVAARLLIEGDVLDPNTIRRLRSAEEWDLFHELVCNVGYNLARTMLSAPSAAVEAVSTYYPPHIARLFDGTSLVPSICQQIQDDLLRSQSGFSWRDLSPERSFARLVEMAKKSHRAERLAEAERMG